VSVENDPAEFITYDDDDDEGRSAAYERLELIHENVLRCFDNPAGEFVLAWLYDEIKMGATSFVRGYPDQTAFNEGKRWVLLRIQQELRMDDNELFRRARKVTRQLEKTHE